MMATMMVTAMIMMMMIMVVVRMMVVVTIDDNLLAICVARGEEAEGAVFLALHDLPIHGPDMTR